MFRIQKQDCGENNAHNYTAELRDSMWAQIDSNVLQRGEKLAMTLLCSCLLKASFAASGTPLLSSLG